MCFGCIAWVHGVELVLGSAGWVLVAVVGWAAPVPFWLRCAQVGYIMDKYGFAVTAHIVNVLGFIYGAFVAIPEVCPGAPRVDMQN